VAQVIELPGLPARFRAGLPAELRGLRRDHVRLMVIDRAMGRIDHSRFDQIGRFLRPGDLLVLNSSRVLPAALRALRADGGLVQIRPCVRRPHLWDALAVEPQPPHGNVELRVNETIRLGTGLSARVLGRRPDNRYLWRLQVDGDEVAGIMAAGEPIRYSYVPDPVPLDHYQPVYATHPGSAESPSAGRPFTWEVLLGLRQQGIEIADIVLHTGLSSFQDDAFDAEHHLYEEWFEVGAETAGAVGLARSRGDRVIAVGTTVVRALESAAAEGRVAPASGWTKLAIGPRCGLTVVDALLTGLHEPQASHFDLLRAILDEPALGRAYSEAMARGYLWHEFGDSFLIL
jgi:S-adenosylmethionine:tRNA ribosyltransferase-isomerase